MRRVKGILFLDYVRMLRGRKGIDWSVHLPPEDVAHLHASIDPAGWYPMETFERMGNAILRVIARDDLVAVRIWGRYSVDQLAQANPMLLAPGDPIETLNRFRVLRSTFFDFDALELLLLVDESAEVAIHYHMGMPAEEAASVQTMGFFERLLEMSGARGVDARFRQRSWKGDPRTLLALSWRMP